MFNLQSLNSLTVSLSILLSSQFSTKIPKVKNENEEKEFWATHDFTDYIDWGTVGKSHFLTSNPLLEKYHYVFRNLWSKRRNFWQTKEIIKNGARVNQMDQNSEHEQHCSPQFLIIRGHFLESFNFTLTPITRSFGITVVVLSGWLTCQAHVV